MNIYYFAKLWTCVQQKKIILRIYANSKNISNKLTKVLYIDGIENYSKKKHSSYGPYKNL